MKVYPNLPKSLLEPFRQACIAGIDPKAQCPICKGKRIGSEMRYRFCYTHNSFEDSHLLVSCHRCHWTWGVVATGPRKACGSSQEIVGVQAVSDAS